MGQKDTLKFVGRDIFFLSPMAEICTFRWTQRMVRVFPKSARVRSDFGLYEHLFSYYEPAQAITGFEKPVLAL
jgi:hypothetical protein